MIVFVIFKYNNYNHRSLHIYYILGLIHKTRILVSIFNAKTTSSHFLRVTTGNNTFAMNGKCCSRKLTVEAVFPTPPFWLATDITRPIFFLHVFLFRCGRMRKPFSSRMCLQNAFLFLAILDFFSIVNKKHLFL